MARAATTVHAIEEAHAGLAARRAAGSDSSTARTFAWIGGSIVFAVVAYAMRPKTEQPQAREVSSPTVEDGTAAKDYFGTCWINHDDNFLLGWKVVGRDPIRSKGGK